MLTSQAIQTNGSPAREWALDWGGTQDNLFTSKVDFASDSPKLDQDMKAQIGLFMKSALVLSAVAPTFTGNAALVEPLQEFFDTAKAENMLTTL